MEKYGVVDKDGKKMNLTYDEYMRLKSDMPLYLATAQTTQDSFPQAENLDGTHNVAEKNKKSTPTDKKIAKKSSAGEAGNTGNTDAGDADAESGRQHSLRERKHQQINPIVSNGQVRAEYQDLLDKKEYTPERIADWDAAAVDWIKRHGGVLPSAELIAEGTAPEERHIATLVRRHLLESEIANTLPQEMREEIEYRNLASGTEWGREGIARRLAALTLDSIERVRALFRRLHDNMPDEERVKLRNDVLDRTGVDVFNLPDDIVNNKHLLDRVLRAELAHKSKWFDKAYEYWINAILSAPHTHAANIIGNTANAAYELGPKRFAEAAINAIARRKDGATFGEFREMWKAIDVKTAWRNALDAFDLETLSPEGKFRENAAVARKVLFYITGPEAVASNCIVESYARIQPENGAKIIGGSVGDKGRSDLRIMLLFRDFFYWNAGPCALYYS